MLLWKVKGELKICLNNKDFKYAKNRRYNFSD